MSLNASWTAPANHTKVFYGSFGEKYGYITFYLFMLTYCMCTNASIIAIIRQNPRFHTPHFLLIVFYSLNDMMFCCNDSTTKFVLLAREMQSPMLYCQSASFLTSVSLLASTHLLGLISMERWVFFCKPYHYLKWMAMTNISIIAAGIYAMGIIALGIVEVYYPRNNIRPATLSCVSKDSSIIQNILFFGLYLFPSGAMTVFSLVQLFKVARRSPAIAPVPVSQNPATQISCVTWGKLKQNPGPLHSAKPKFTQIVSPTSNPNAVGPSASAPEGQDNRHQHLPRPNSNSNSTINYQKSRSTLASFHSAAAVSDESSMSTTDQCTDCAEVIMNQDLTHVQYRRKPSKTRDTDPDESGQIQFVRSATAHAPPHDMKSKPPQQLDLPAAPLEMPAPPAISFPAYSGVGTKIPVSYKRVLKMILIVSGSFWLTFIPGFLISTWILASGVTWEDLNTRITPSRIFATHKFAYFMFYDLSKIVNPMVIFYTHPQLRRGLCKLMGRAVAFETVEG